MTRLISISIFLILALIAGLCYGADGAKSLSENLIFCYNVCC